MKARRIVVRYHDQIVGQLATNGVETLFEYDPSWLKNGHDLAPLTMKRRSGLVRGEPEFDHLPPLFAGSLPDDYGKGIMRQWFRKTFGSTHFISPLEMLAYVGETGMGALTYHPRGQYISGEDFSAPGPSLPAKAFSRNRGPGKT